MKVSCLVCSRGTAPPTLLLALNSVKESHSRKLDHERVARGEILKGILAGLSTQLAGVSRQLAGVSTLVTGAQSRETTESGLEDSRLPDSVGQPADPGDSTSGTSAGPKEVFNMKLKHADLKSFYDEWYGIGDFNDTQGGVHGRETSLEKGWPKHIGAQHYSRIVNTINSYAKSHRITIDLAIEQLQQKFALAKGSTFNMIRLLMDDGLVTRGKTRGRKCPPEVAADDLLDGSNRPNAA